MLTYDELRLVVADRTAWSLPATLRWRAAGTPDKPYLQVPAEGRTTTYSEMLDIAERVGAAFVALGGRPGDRVAIMADNSGSYLDAWFGSAFAGLVEAPINTAYRGAFLEHQLRTVAPRFVVTDPQYASRFLEVREHLDVEAFFVFDGPERVEAIDELADVGWRAERFASLYESPAGGLPEIDPKALGAVFFTSGTTGLSKGVMMSHSHLHFYAEQGAALTRLTDRDVYMSVGPLFHGNAQFLAASPALLAGAQFVLHPRFSASRWLSSIRECGATVTNLIGVMMSFLWDQPATDHDRHNELRCIFSAPTASSILDAFMSRFGIEAFVECFGLTEISMPVLTPYGQARPAGAAGLLVADWFEAKIVDPETDEELPNGVVGEFVVRSKVPFTMCSGYYDNPIATAGAERNLWFHTGDGVRRDADGWYYFVDRLKDYIRRRGENISSFEVEQAILANPDVEECAVVAVRATVEAGEDELMVCVVPSNALVEPKQIHDWCVRNLPTFTVPRYVRLFEALPRTPTEKIQKVKLRELGVDAGTFDAQTSET